MQGRARDQRDLLDVESVTGHLLEPRSVYAFLAQHRHRLFPAELFAEMAVGVVRDPTVRPADPLAHGHLAVGPLLQV